MKLFEMTQIQNFKQLSPEQQRFTAKLINIEVKRIAKEKAIPEEKAYWGFTHGLYGSDRSI
ncbi:MAG: hypothetical protein E7222_13170 [Clostridiales bacterium]|nr:hypothetical protein [Clostridiales bacterium]